MLACPNKAMGEAALSALTALTNHMVAGLAPRELAPFIAGAPLMALNKQEVCARLLSKRPFGASFPSVAVTQPLLKIAKLFSARFKWELQPKVVRRPRFTRQGNWQPSLGQTQARSC